MEKIITTIVNQQVSKLAKDRLYYTQKDLSDYGFPQFLIKRITFYLLRELNHEFSLPGDEWLNSESDQLLADWAELQRTIKREIRLPAPFAEEMIEKSVKECVGMTIQPRKVIPQLLFEDRTELDSNQLTERSSAITVNRFLVWSMVRYMEKKNRESLNITDATRILESIDNKIVESYHPLNWLSLVKPLYELSGSTVHSDLFRRFFENKGKNHLAKEFDLIDGEIKESQFIEILSSPNSIHVAGYKDDQQSLFQEENTEEVQKNVDDADMSGEDLFENQNEVIEDLSDDTPIFQSFREDSVNEPDEWDADEEDDDIAEEDVAEERGSIPKEDLTKVQQTDPVEDDEKQQPADSEEDEEEIEDIENIADEPELNPVEDDERQQPSGPEEDEEGEQKTKPVQDTAKEDIQDDDLKAPWEEEEEGYSFTFIRNDDDEDLPDSEIEDLKEEEREKADDLEEQKALIDEEKEITKKDESNSDATLLEVNDEEVLEAVPGEESEAAILEIDSESDEDPDEKESSLLNRFMFDDSDTEDSLADMESDRDKRVTTIYDELNLTRNNTEPETMDLFGSLKTPEIRKKTSRSKLDDKNSESKTEESKTIQKFSDIDESESEKESDDTEVPMWRSFLERDENEAKSVFQFNDESADDEGLNIEDTDEKLDEEGFIEEPIYDFTKKEVDLDEKIGDISNWLKDVRETFIEDLFGDSEGAYEQALADIMEFDDWKNASKYIEREIFTRNRIDIYDEIAVDFTDRLHSYFIENKS